MGAGLGARVQHMPLPKHVRSDFGPPPLLAFQVDFHFMGWEHCHSCREISSPALRAFAASEHTNLGWSVDAVDRILENRNGFKERSSSG